MSRAAPTPGLRDLSREFLTFQLKTILTGGRTLRSADACTLWYDGRR